MLFNLPEPSETGKKFSKGDFQNKVYPVLAAIAPYADYLEMSKASALTQSKVPREIVKAIQNGLTHKGLYFLISPSSAVSQWSRKLKKSRPKKLVKSNM